MLEGCGSRSRAPVARGRRGRPAGDRPRRSDECGIIVAGAETEGAPQDWRAVVLEDASVRASSPTAWAQAAIDAFYRHGADRLVAEVNQGGELVESVVRQINA